MKITEQQLREFALSLWQVAFTIGYESGTESFSRDDMNQQLCTEMLDDFITDLNAKNFIDEMSPVEKNKVKDKLPDFTFATGDKDPLKAETKGRRYFAGFPMVEDLPTGHPFNVGKEAFKILENKLILSSTPSMTALDAGVPVNPMRRRMMGDWGNGVVGYDPAAPGGEYSVTGFKCMHGTILYGNKCIRCERLKESVTDLNVTKVELVDDEILLSQIPKDSIFKATEPDEADKRIDVFANKDRLCEVVSRYTSLSQYTTMLILTRTKGLTMRKLVHKALYRRGMALCGSTSREQDGQWYADHHIETVLADVMKELNHENNH